MLIIENTALVVIDVQGRLARVVAESDNAIGHIQTLVQGAMLLGLPVLLTAQAPEKLGHTIPEIAEAATQTGRPAAHQLQHLA